MASIERELSIVYKHRTYLQRALVCRSRYHLYNKEVPRGTYAHVRRFCAIYKIASAWRARRRRPSTGVYLLSSVECESRLLGSVEVQTYGYRPIDLELSDANGPTREDYTVRAPTVAKPH